jgi:hypothetical protein
LLQTIWRHKEIETYNKYGTKTDTAHIVWRLINPLNRVTGTDNARIETKFPYLESFVRTIVYNTVQ